ncbi:hypothetical protein C8R47DRAFT_67728 [Mycena vitilis]|nr:hypothetical protein C8R47DRAFT_67728 [Mycena vitilis]
MKSLTEDVLLYLLQFSDIASVLAVSRTCKYFHLLSQDQRLWVALVETLTANLFRDPLPEENLRTLPTRALVGLAKRAARGPETWVDPSPESPPTLVRELRIPCPSIHQANFFAGRAELLQGGRYVVVAHRATVMVLDAAAGGKITGAIHMGVHMSTAFRQRWHPAEILWWSC